MQVQMDVYSAFKKWMFKKKQKKTKKTTKKEVDVSSSIARSMKGKEFN